MDLSEVEKSLRLSKYGQFLELISDSRMSTNGQVARSISQQRGRGGQGAERVRGRGRLKTLPTKNSGGEASDSTGVARGAISSTNAGAVVGPLTERCDRVDGGQKQRGDRGSGTAPARRGDNSRTVENEGKHISLELEYGVIGKREYPQSSIESATRKY